MEYSKDQMEHLEMNNTISEIKNILNVIDILVIAEGK